LERKYDRSSPSSRSNAAFSIRGSSAGYAAVVSTPRWLADSKPTSFGI